MGAQAVTGLLHPHITCAAAATGLASIRNAGRRNVIATRSSPRPR